MRSASIQAKRRVGANELAANTSMPRPQAIALCVSALAEWWKALRTAAARCRLWAQRWRFLTLSWLVLLFFSLSGS